MLGENPVPRTSAGAEKDDIVPFDFTCAELSAVCYEADDVKDGTQDFAILYRIAHIRRISPDQTKRQHAESPRTEQFRSAIAARLSHDGCRVEHFFSLFQVL